MRRLLSAFAMALLPGLCTVVPAHAAGPVTLLTQARSVSAESRDDLDRTGNNPDQYCTVDDVSESAAAEFGAFEAQAVVQPVQYECHTLLAVSAVAYQNSRLSSTGIEFDGHVSLSSWGTNATDQGGHVLASSSGSVVFQLTEEQDYRLKGTLSAGESGLSSLRIVDTSDDSAIVSRSAAAATDGFDLTGQLPAGTYEFTVEAGAECGRDCSTWNSCQLILQFGTTVPVPATSMGTLKARY